MLSIVVNSPEKREIQYHIGEPFPKLGGCVIWYVQASDDELLHIARKFTGIHMCNNRVVRWFGDDARFIVNNW